MPLPRDNHFFSLPDLPVLGLHINGLRHYVFPMMIFKRQIPKRFKVSLKQSSDKDSFWDQIPTHSLSSCHERLYSGDTDETDHLCPKEFTLSWGDTAHTAWSESWSWDSHRHRRRPNPVWKPVGNQGKFNVVPRNLSQAANTLYYPQF